MNLRDRAFAVAARAHRGQVDKAGRPYLLAHVVDVVNRVDEWDDMAVPVAWLHDVLEDSDITEEELRAEFPAGIVDAVVAITHLPHEPRVDYYARVKVNQIARQVKLADIASNTDSERMALLDESTRVRLTAKYEQARKALS